jgi:Domain of unknown function (DUF3854)
VLDAQAFSCTNSPTLTQTKPQSPLDPSSKRTKSSILGRSLLGKRVATDHEQEWLDSGVDPQIVHLNVLTLTDSEVDGHRHEMQYPIAERLNWTVTRSSRKKSLRGWWVSGIDPLNHWQQMSWGRFKPDAATPVIDKVKGKAAKYLSPSLGKGSSRLILLDVPSSIWHKVSARYSILISKQDYRHGFWHWVSTHQIPVVLTEGEKKAGCLLSAGYAAIALPGIFGGYRKEGQQIIPELAVFAAQPRDFYICFDYETRSTVIQQLDIALTKLGSLLTRAQANVKITTLPGPEKGVDDFVVAQGIAAFDELIKNSIAFESWQASQAWRLSHKPDVELSQPYLGEVKYPNSGLVCIKSPKGTGKTTALRSLITTAQATDRKVLVITHRIQLGKSICQNLGLHWITQVKPGVVQSVDGFGLCIDSLHPLSQAKFDASDWAGAIVILDEIEQVLWHALNSTTCYNSRVRILETLKELVQTVLSTDGLIVAQDADLSDISIEYLLTLAESPIKPWLVVNDWKTDRTASTYLYDTKNPAALLLRMEQVLETGAVYVCLDSQKVKGRWSSRNLETYLCDRFPEKRVLRIDSETVIDTTHPAYGIAKDINAVVKNYDIVLATPTIGTGVSIDLTNHFAGVFGIFNGVTSDAESRQALARVRDRVPRYVWASHYGLGKIGNGSCYYRDIAASTTKSVKYNIMLLQQVDFDLDRGSDPLALRTWSKLAARVNLSLTRYRREMQLGLQREGHTMTIVTDDAARILNNSQYSVEDLHALTVGDRTIDGYEYLGLHHAEHAIEDVYRTLTQVRQDNQLLEAEAVSESGELLPRKERLNDEAQRHSDRKRELKSRYSVNVTPDLLLKDEQGWHAQLRLHYYLTHDPLFVQLRDRAMLQSHIDRGNGQVALQDIKLLTAQVEMLRAIGLLSLLDPERRTRVTDEDVQRMWATLLAHRQDVRTLFNMNLTDRMAPMTAIQSLLAKLDVRLICVSRDRNTVNGCRGGLRVYKYVVPEDGRDRIFAQWQAIDEGVLTKA